MSCRKTSSWSSLNSVTAKNWSNRWHVFRSKRSETFVCRLASCSCRLCLTRLARSWETIFISDLSEMSKANWSFKATIPSGLSNFWSSLPRRITSQSSLVWNNWNVSGTSISKNWITPVRAFSHLRTSLAVWMTESLAIWSSAETSTSSTMSSSC